MVNSDENGEGSIGEEIVSEPFENKTLVISELLFFVSNYTKVGSCTPDNIKKIILSHFDEEEIWKAKSLLWRNVKEGVLRKLENRNDTRQHTSKDANACDIVQAFQDMDKKSYYNIVCLAADIKRMPLEHPENLHELSILDRISVLENKFKLVESSTNRNYAGMIEIAEEVKKISGGLATQETLLNNVAEQIQDECKRKTSESCKSVHEECDRIPRFQNDKVRSNSFPETGNNKDRNNSNNDIFKIILEREKKLKTWKDTLPGRSRMHSNKKSNTGEKRLSTNDRNQHNMRNSGDRLSCGRSRLRNHPLKQGNSRQNSFIDKKRYLSQRTLSRDNEKIDDVFFKNRGSTSNRRDSSGFQYPRDQMRRLHYKNKIAESSLMRLFVFNVPNKYNVDNVYYHFTDLGVNVKDVSQRSHPDARKKSFVVKMPKDEINYVLDDEIMESLNIRLREYTNFSDQ